MFYTKLFSKEHEEMKSRIKELEDNVFQLKNDLLDLSSKIKLLVAH